MPSADQEKILRRNNVQIVGDGNTTLLLAHGFGCDQSMWRFLVPLLKGRYRLVLFDYVGSGNSDLSAFDQERYSSLEGYARDVVEICEALDLKQVTLVGHSVSSMIGLLASEEAPAFFQRLVMVCPSPCFLNVPPDYEGGFEEEDLRELLSMMETNYLGWASFLAPMVMGADASDPLVDELSTSFCSTDRQAARTFAEATFFSDYRHILPGALHPVLILQSETDALAPPRVGRYIEKNIPDSQLITVKADGHSLHMTHPVTVADAIDRFCLAEASE